VGAYAVRSAGSRLFVLLFNKDTADRQTTVQFPAGTLSGAAGSLWRFDAAHRLGAAGTVTPSGGALSLTLPARSATLAVLETGAPLASDFYTLTPCRLADTRDTAGPYGGPALASGVARSFDLANRCGVPAAARAVSLNITVVSPVTGGHVVGYAGGSAAPGTSVLSFSAGQLRADNTVLPVSQDGKATLTVKANLTSGSAQLILDVNGYFQ
jgi:hypothetical protein